MSGPATGKRQRLDNSAPAMPRSLNREVSPPDRRRKSTAAISPDSELVDLTQVRRRGPANRSAREPIDPTGDEPWQSTTVDLTHDHDDPVTARPAGPTPTAAAERAMVGGPMTVPQLPEGQVASPFKLTRIRDLPASHNVDTVHLREILGDVLLKTVWIFNYMHDIPWVMSHFDPDVRNHVEVIFVHGNWKREDESRKRMEEEVSQFANARIVCAYMPEMYGTHHTKLMVLFRRDETVQVIVHTANMIPFDWTNMTQAAWLSPWLPMIPQVQARTPAPIGDRFKSDLLAYFHHYGNNRTGPLTNALKNYDFSSVRAIFIASVPGRHPSPANFGWPALFRKLRTVPCPPSPSPRIIAQISSIATIGQTDKWLTPVLFKALSQSASPSPSPPVTSVIFPTAPEVRNSLEGYRSGTSIHIRLTSPAQKKQLDYLTPMLQHWSSPDDQAGRAVAAPHIKTYIRFRDNTPNPEIDWALLTSANLSTQAWGTAEKDSNVRVCSYEAGVLVHPGLWGDDYTMKAVYKTDSPLPESTKTVALRMPYTFPPIPYAPDEKPWWIGEAHSEPDAFGIVLEER